ncbi:MAG TPA: ATP-binding cassette domain-containing protein [Mycobacteriales bacterium]|nr:ATP-binding cassette domain-containing protein [Mycobacteriales bacterium]
MTRSTALKRGAVVAAVLLIAFVTLRWILPDTLTVDGTTDGRWQSPPAILLKGVIVGMTYGLLGVGLVLIYRSNRIINFAHGNIGAFGSVIFVLLVREAHLPYWLGLVPALVGAGLVGAASESAVIRRLRKAPLVMSVVATLGIGQFLDLMGLVLDPSTGQGTVFPQPPGLPSFQVGALLVTPSYFAMLVFSPVIVVALGAFLRYSRFGVGLRCAADNPEAARMAGIFASRMSTLAWALGGAIACLTAIFTAPTQTSAAGSFGPSLLEVALAAAVIARMESLPITLVAGVGIGLIEQLLQWNYPKSGFYSVILFGLIVGALLLQKQRTGRAEAKGSWAAVQALPPLPVELRQIWIVRNLGRIGGVVLVALLALLPSVISSADAVQMSAIFAFVIVGLSAGVITGLAGQLSLGQFGIAAVGAVASYEVAVRTGDYYLSFLYAGAAAAVVSVLIGLPALRVKGLLLTVTTLSFSLVVQRWLLGQHWSFGTGVVPGSPKVFGQVLSLSKHYYYFALALAVASFVLAGNVRRGGIGRLFIAVRDNEDNARAFTVPAARVKVQGFAIAGFLAGIGGAVYAHSLPEVNSESFSADFSTKIIVMAVIGGLGLLSGPLLGALLVFALPTFVTLGSLGLAGTALGQLLIIMYLPGGLGSLVQPARDRVMKVLAKRFSSIDVDAAFLAESSSGAAESAVSAATTMPAFVAPNRPATKRRVPALEAAGLVKSFGGVRAVRGVDLAVHPGEILGLIGPNGAGKTTTFELLTGFTALDAGTVRLAGADVTDLGPEARGQRGLIRSFQDAALFPTLTVLDCVTLALERNDPARFLPALAGLRRQDRRKDERARELVAWMGLDRYRSAQVQSLSTGTRRITEIACLVGLNPSILLLDEPCAGVAQKETEALAELLLTLKKDLDLTLMIIEHDIPMIMGMSDRIICMADGEIIAEGGPDVVRNDPKVVESYLGASSTAIERSGLLPAPVPAKPAPPRTPALARSAT